MERLSTLKSVTREGSSTPVVDPDAPEVRRFLFVRFFLRVLVLIQLLSFF